MYYYILIQKKNLNLEELSLNMYLTYYINYVHYLDNK